MILLDGRHYTGEYLTAPGCITLDTWTVCTMKASLGSILSYAEGNRPAMVYAMDSFGFPTRCGWYAGSLAGENIAVNIHMKIQIAPGIE